MEMIMSSNMLRCGIVGGRPGFATYNDTSNSWVGMDIDYCRGLSAALFGQDTDHLEFVEYMDSMEGFQGLANKEVADKLFVTETD